MSFLLKRNIQVPNQELSGAKSELPGGTVGVCSFHRMCGQLSYNLPITHLRFTPRNLQECLLAHEAYTNKKYEEKMHIEVSETIFLRLFQ